jgi:hypothetical protein
MITISTIDKPNIIDIGIIKIGICCFSAKHTALRRKSKDSE